MIKNEPSPAFLGLGFDSVALFPNKLSVFEPGPFIKLFVEGDREIKRTIRNYVLIFLSQCE